MCMEVKAVNRIVMEIYTRFVWIMIINSQGGRVLMMMGQGLRDILQLFIMISGLFMEDWIMQGLLTLIFIFIILLIISGLQYNH
jgi:hypothetical protein